MPPTVCCPRPRRVPLPDQVDDVLAAGSLLRGLTVDMLTQQVHPIGPGATVLVQAAAGGVGRLLCQMASHLGATVIGTVGSSEKVETARAAGCAHPILYREADVAVGVARITVGRGVDVVYDSVGADTFPGSLACLAVRGHLVNYGQSSGPVAPIAMSTLAEKSLTISRPILFHYITDTHRYRAMAAMVFADFTAGILRAPTATRFPLAEAGAAHDTLETRRATGALVLLP